MTFVLRIGHLYPDVMNLYGDRGNVLALAQRARWRGFGVEIIPISLGDPFRPDAVDLLFAGGDQDREQRRVAADLAGRKGEAIRAAIEEGLPALVVCGSYQLFGERYQPAAGPELRGLAVFDAVTIHPGATVVRCVGNIVVDWEGSLLVGFENHGGRTYLGPRAAPLGRVVVGYGNNGEDGTEGARYKNAFGTYLHGALLPKNPMLADTLLSLALQRRGEDPALAPLDERVEEAARRVAIARARRERHALRNVGATRRSPGTRR
ncbi:MAG: glutamine amidotransferase [Chloroflexota bacterium]|nr:glutamine amidotransferase [Dehalococcoidia bacterium]MDW8253808.1 glutamine amidotransferase [Chloroflexota bacterium]